MRSSTCESSIIFAVEDVLLLVGASNELVLECRVETDASNSDKSSLLLKLQNKKCDH